MVLKAVQAKNCLRIQSVTAQLVSKLPFSAEVAKSSDFCLVERCIVEDVVLLVCFTV